MTSKAATVEEYLAELPEDRRAAIGAVRDVIDDKRMTRPAALAVAIALGIPPGEDRRQEVARALR